MLSLKTPSPIPAALQYSPARGMAAPVNGLEAAGDAGPPSFTAVPWPEGEELERLENFHFHSGILPDDRTVSVHLPVEYAREPERRFPVLYLHDGQNLFDDRTAFVPGHTWRAGATADRTAATGKAAWATRGCGAWLSTRRRGMHGWAEARATGTDGCWSRS